MVPNLIFLEDPLGGVQDKTGPQTSSSAHIYALKFINYKLLLHYQKYGVENNYIFLFIFSIGFYKFNKYNSGKGKIVLIPYNVRAKPWSMLDPRLGTTDLNQKSSHQASLNSIVITQFIRILFFIVKCIFAIRL